MTGKTIAMPTCIITHTMQNHRLKAYIIYNIWYQIGPSSYNYSSANRLTNRCRYLSCNWQLWFNLKAINMSKEDLFYFDTSSINVKNINKVFFFFFSGQRACSEDSRISLFQYCFNLDVLLSQFHSIMTL